jgi:hypothetical protein
MTEINNGRKGSAMLGVCIDIYKKEPISGSFHRNCISMNTQLGLVWADVSFWVAEKEIFHQDVLLHSISVREWASAIEGLAREEGGIVTDTHYGYERRVRFDIASPELIINTHQYYYKPQRPLKSKKEENPKTGHFSYDMLVVVDTSIAAGNKNVAGEGPAMYLEPGLDSLLRFARDLRSETEVTLLLSEK